MGFDPKPKQPMTRRQMLGRGAMALFSLAVLLHANPAAAELSEDDLADVKRVEAYIDGIRTLEAKFQQFDAQGGLSFGRIYLRRPGRMRVEYDPPVPVLVIADGIFINYYDRELDQVTGIPLKDSPAWFLLRSPMNIGKDITVTSVDRAPGALRISMYQTNQQDLGTVTLIFADNPIELRQWSIIDAQNKEVRVGLYDVRLGGDIPPGTFATPRPLRGTQGGGN